MLAYPDTYPHIHITTYVVTKSAPKVQGGAQEFSLGSNTEGPKIEDESQERGWGSWGGRGSKPLLTS